MDDPVDLGEATYDIAVFMPSACRVLGVPGKNHRTKKSSLERISYPEEPEFRVTRHSKLRSDEKFCSPG
jgi:hypothetical protein